MLSTSKPIIFFHTGYTSLHTLDYRVRCRISPWRGGTDTESIPSRSWRCESQPQKCKQAPQKHRILSMTSQISVRLLRPKGLVSSQSTGQRGIRTVIGMRQSPIQAQRMSTSTGQSYTYPRIHQILIGRPLYGNLYDHAADDSMHPFAFELQLISTGIPSR
ncbi:hypothetical protein L218DRAFT_420050 [Marasmius fiardii PR-910]|nr:hypothetical protein L218DRAFT_420050 [Marasmius fiardii PR-910]